MRKTSMKGKLLKLSIILSILSIFYILLAYFGIIRYLKFHLYLNRDLIRDYSLLEKASKKTPVIVTFTCKPENISNLKPFLQSVLDQTVKVDKIIFFTPRNIRYKIPDYVKDIATVVPAAKDYGYGTSIVPALLKEKNANSIILSCKSNVVYGKDFIQNIIYEAEKNPNSLIVDEKNKSIVLRPSFYDCKILGRNKKLLNKNWFLQNCKNKTKRILEYKENYQTFF